MTSDIKPEVIKRTQELLGKHIKRPPLTEKLLRKPPFRFLHDIITAVIQGTGFLSDVLTASEMSHENIKDKESKIAYLKKIIDAINIQTGATLTVRPSKIVAGHEPTKTNEMLQAIGKALDKRRKNAEVAGAVPKKPSRPLAKEVTKAKPVKPTAGQPLLNSKETEKKKQSKQPMKIKSQPEVPKREEEILIESDPMGEKIGVNTHPETDASIPVEESLEVEEEEKLVIKEAESQELEIKRPPSAHLRQRQPSAVNLPNAGLESMKNKPEDKEEVPLRRPMSVRPTTARPASARPAAPRIRDRGEVAKPEDSSLASGRVNVITDSVNMEDDDENNFLVLQTKPTPLEEEKHDEPKPIEDGQHGHLVEQILETQKDLEVKSNQSVTNVITPVKKVGIEWEGGRKKDREAVREEVEKLRTIIQKATSVVNPLGKLMDYVQEDVDAMQRELELWQEANKKLSLQLREEQRLTDLAIEPMQLQLEHIDQSIKEKRAQISVLKASVLSNDNRIKRLLMADTGITD